MALESTDLLVVQKQSGAKEIRKASLSQLSDYLQAEPGVIYKGLANFTDGAEEPASKNMGDLYINNAPGDGTWAWSANSDGITDVKTGDRALYNGTTWDIIQSGSDDAGVTSVTASLPLSVTGTAEEPNIESRQATTTDSGHVARLATDADVKKDGTGSTTAVVTADLLKQTNIALDAATSGGVTNLIADAPITVTTDGTDGSSSNSPLVGIEDGAIGQKGAVELYDGDTAITDPSASADYATWVATLDATKVMSMQATAKNFAVSDFSSLADA
jgi:hypothetical protein